MREAQAQRLRAGREEWVEAGAGAGSPAGWQKAEVGSGQEVDGGQELDRVKR